MFAFIKKIFGKSKSGKIQFQTGISSLDDTYLFDFKNYASQYNQNSTVIFSAGVVSEPSEGERQDPQPQQYATRMIDYSDKENQFIAVKPKDVLHELETIPTPFSLTLLDEKIKILKDKASLITQQYSKREVEALIERVENRKKYLKHKQFFDAFENTTDEKIEALLNKHGLVMKTSDIFIPEFPDDAIKVMKAYEEKMKEICNKKPVFYVIAQKELFKEAFKKRDPILLVQSPFGFYWQILGAWDEEMLILHEL